MPLKPRPLITRSVGALACAAALWHTPALADELPTRITLGAEVVHLPAGERMGLAGGAVLFDAGDAWWLGPAVYGAASGSRGGLFVGGLQVLKRWPIAPRWWLQASAYAGGGGGGSAPVGGGLMWRPELAVMHEFGAFEAGLGWSHVRFATGDIASSQLGVLLSWRGDFVHRGLDAGATHGPARTGFGFDELAGTATRYNLRNTPGRRIGLVGARAEHASGTRAEGAGDAWRWGIEAAAAAQGDAAGYMEILGTLGRDIALGADAPTAPRITLRGALGLGGGGAVPTGGGAIGKLAAGLAWPLGNGVSVGAEAGIVRALDAPLRARTAQLWLSMNLEPPAAAPAVRSEWAATIQGYAHARRVDGSSRDLQTIGLKLNRYVGESLYLSAQAHSAFAGGAGAYSVGLVGAGLATRAVDAPWQFGAELLAGAAGGGGVVTGGGAIVQALAWAGWRWRPEQQWRLGVGAVRSLRGDLSTPIAELTWMRAFGL
ncbi:MAG: hypothetical protein U1E89_17570 [Burkholderiaceae bacterium]